MQSGVVMSGKQCVRLGLSGAVARPEGLASKVLDMREGVTGSVTGLSMNENSHTRTCRGHLAAQV